MTLNQNMVKGKWLEIKGDIQKTWGKLTHDELEKTEGDIKSLSGLIQQKYGEGQESFDKKLSSIIEKFENRNDKVVGTMKDKLKN